MVIAVRAHCNPLDNYNLYIIVILQNRIIFYAICMLYVVIHWINVAWLYFN